MKDIETCNDLIKLLGKDKVDKLFTEYFMLTVAKSNLYDELSRKGDIDDAERRNK